MFERGERPTGPGEEITEWRDRDGYLIRETRTEAPDGSHDHEGGGGRRGRRGRRERSNSALAPDRFKDLRRD
jgi:hypothetical protein